MEHASNTPIAGEPGPLMDTLRIIATPEGVELTLRLAGPSARIRAWLMDTLLRMAMFGGISGALAALGTVGIGISTIVWFLLEWFYPVVFEVMRSGATPGKQMYGLCVVAEDGTPVDWSASMIRNVLRAVDFLPFAYTLGFLSMLIGRDFQRLGDLAAGTLVVHRGAASKHGKVPAAPPLAAPVNLTVQEQRALIDFAQRTTGWSTDRANELAELAAPLLDGQTGDDARLRLIGIARYLLGQR